MRRITSEVQTYPESEHLPVFGHAGSLEGDFDVPMHTHPGTELVFVVFGSCIIHVMDQTLSGAPGTVMVLPAEIPHDQIHFEKTRAAFVTFTVSQGVFDQRPRSVDVGTDSWVYRWIENIREINQAGGSHTSPLYSGLLWSILQAIKSCEDSLGGAREVHPAITRAVDAIEQNLYEPFDLGSLAQHSCVSQSHLTSLFGRHLGCTPQHYHQRLRMARARELLETPYHSISEISRMCGYEDPNYFTRVFRKSQGCSPRRYRKEHISAGRS